MTLHQRILDELADYFGDKYLHIYSSDSLIHSGVDSLDVLTLHSVLEKHLSVNVDYELLLERIRLDRESEANHDLNRLLDKPVQCGVEIYLENIFLDSAFSQGVISSQSSWRGAKR